MSTHVLLEELEARRKDILSTETEEGADRQHRLGKKTARERLDMFLDADSFQEFGQFVQHRCTHFDQADKRIPSDAVVTGCGRVDGRPVFVFAQNFTAHGGTMGEMGAKKICEVLKRAESVGAPVVSFLDSGGARIQEGVDALSGYGSIFFQNVKCSGKVPQISIVAGPCAGGATYSPALTDFIIMVDGTSQMFVTGPAVVKSISGENVTAEELGGARIHAATSGVVHFLVQSEQEAVETAKQLLSYLPSNAEEVPPVIFPKPEKRDCQALDALIPKVIERSYDVMTVINEIVDPGSFLEVQALFAPNVVVGFARMDGRSVGIVANQPKHLEGFLDMDAADKAARFIQFCDCFHLPLLTLTDVPGFYPGTTQEHAGVIRHGAKMLYAYADAQVPKITVIMGKAYGGGYLAMCCKQLGADAVYAWPTGQIAVMSAESAVEVTFRKERARLPAQTAAEKQRDLLACYKELFDSPYPAAARGYVDEVIRPSETRERILSSLCILETKTQSGNRHRNMPF